MMHDRVRIGTQLLAPGSLFYVSIDRDEHWNLEPLLFQLFGKANFVEDIVWQKAYGGGSKTKLINNLHEYVACFSRDKSALPFLALPPDPKALKYYKLSDSKVSTRGKYRTQPLYTNSNDYRENLTYPLPCPACAQSDPTWNEDWRSIRELLGTNALQLRGKPGSWSYVLVQPNGTETPWSGQLIYPPKQWQWEWQSTRQALINDELLAEFDDGNWVVNYKQYRFDEDGNERGKKPGSIRIGPYTQTGTKEITDLFGAEVIKFPKPTGLIEELIGVNLGGSDLPVLDYFAGSGTTGHAVINLNRDEGENGKRKYILVEMGDYFDTVLKPRIQKVIYSKDWKDGKPVLREGSSHLFKYLRLESYEDALNNLELKRTEAQDDLLRQNAPLREDYLLRYQLDVESAGSASLLNVAAFVNPFAYQLKIATGSVGESRAVNVDLVETFNYLLGLRVSHTDIIRGFKVVTGLNPAGEKTLVIWRNVAEKSNADLDAFFQKQGYNTKDMEFAVIYVNGDNNLENLKRTDETWKVRRTEDEFKRLMFDVQDV
jgi:adenine-specific DNA-methyltransferase